MSYNFEKIKHTKIIASIMIKECIGDFTAANTNKIAQLNSGNLAHMAEYITHICSHELKEPLKNVSNLIQLLHSQNAEKLDEESLCYIQHIFNNINRMSGLIKGIAHHLEMTKCVSENFPRFA